MDEKIPFYLILVGEGENKKKLSQFIINNNLQKDIKIVNFLENPYPIIKEADLFYYPQNMRDCQMLYWKRVL